MKATVKQDCNSYAGLLGFLYSHESPFYMNQDGETVLLTRGVTEEGEQYIRKEVAQSNNWIRVQHYYESGDYEETYTR